MADHQVSQQYTECAYPGYLRVSRHAPGVHPVHDPPAHVCLFIRGDGKMDGALLEAAELLGFTGIKKVVRIVLPP